MSEEKKNEQFEQEEVSFTSLVLMLAAGAMQNMGLIPNPIDQKVEKNLELAKQMIDLLDILRQKTKGNLEPAESKLLEELIADLKLKFVKIDTKKSV